MKKILIVLALILLLKLQAEWLDDWAEAVEMCQNPNVLEILSANLLSQRVIARA
jgi:hypothetical protein